MRRDLDRHYWVVFGPNGRCLPWTFASWRWSAMKKHIDNTRDEKPWEYHYRRGFRCRKVTLKDGWQAKDLIKD
ncbi:MAG: hypothetical protein WDA42_08315 [Candidatus Bathyarchaeia archaeon]